MKLVAHAAAKVLKKWIKMTSANQKGIPAEREGKENPVKWRFEKAKLEGGCPNNDFPLNTNCCRFNLRKIKFIPPISFSLQLKFVLLIFFID